MEKIRALIEFIVINKDMLLDLLGMFATFLISLGALIEGSLRFIPTKKEDSFLERVGQLLSNIGAKIRAYLDKAKVPNIKKEDPSDK